MQFEKGEHIHVFEAKDPYEEVEYVCATIRHLLMDYPTLRCHDIAIVTNMLSDYQFILEHQMKKYQLPYHIDLGKPIWLDANVKEFQRRSKTRFGKDNFVEEIDFDYMEMQVLEED